MLESLLVGLLVAVLADLDLPLQEFVVQVLDVIAGRVQHGHLVVVERDDLLGVRQEGVGVGSGEVFVFADADDDRAPAPDDHDLEVVVGVDGRDAEGPFQALDRFQQRLFQVAVIIFLDQVGDHFAVGLGLEAVLFGEQFLLQLQVVLDDAVVHDG